MTKIGGMRDSYVPAVSDAKPWLKMMTIVRGRLAASGRARFMNVPSTGNEHPAPTSARAKRTALTSASRSSTQRGLEHLPGCPLRQRLQNRDVAGILEGGQPLAAPRDQIGRASGRQRARK